MISMRCLVATTPITLASLAGLTADAQSALQAGIHRTPLTGGIGAPTALAESCGSVTLVLEAVAQRSGMGTSGRIDSHDQACNAAQDRAIASARGQCDGLFDVGHCSCTGAGPRNRAGRTRYGCRVRWSCSSRTPLRSGIATGTGGLRDAALERAQDTAYRDGAAYCIGAVDVYMDGYSCSSVGSRRGTRHSCLVGWKCAEASRRSWRGMAVENGLRNR